MRSRKIFLGFSSISLVILIGAVIKFAIHLYSAPGYGFFFDELYTNALSRHLAFGYVDLPPLVPALVALSRLLLGDSLFAAHIFPALAGAGTLVFACLITREFGGKTFAVAITALGFIAIPGWLQFQSIFCYDSIDQLILAIFLFTLVRYLRTGNKRLWIVLGALAGIACMTKLTLLFIGPGFIVALLASKNRKDLLTPWPWLGLAIFLILISPYLIWQFTNHWPSLVYWKNYGSLRVNRASVGQYLTNVLIYMSWLLIPLWLAGFYRIFRKLNGTPTWFLGVMIVVNLVFLFLLHATPRMVMELFIPLLAAGAVLIEEIASKLRHLAWVAAPVMLYIAAAGLINISFSLPVIPMDVLPKYISHYRFLFEPLREFNNSSNYPPIILSGRMGWEELAEDVAVVFHSLPAEDQEVAGIYTDTYVSAGAIDQYGPKLGIPHAVSGALTYSLWGPGNNWDVAIIVTDRSNSMAVFFDSCEKAGSTGSDFEGLRGFYFFVCRNLKTPVDAVWNSVKYYY